MGFLALGGALGALLAYFFDPQSGARRRRTFRDRTAGLVSQKVQHLKEEPKEFDDATLADKIRSEVFRDPDIPKGQLNVNVQDGVAQLRGEVPRPELIDELVEQTRKVQGVREVENLLHVPGTEAPMHE
jgi:osmotically-inducible protein OsmY